MPEKILIVDDDVDTLKLVGLMLERQGYEIAVAGNGTQGLSKAGSEKPDLILLDVMMPDLDGYEVAKRLRDDPSLAHIPIIMFTAKSMVDDKVLGFESGVDDYLTKPTHPAELSAHVKAVLARTGQAELSADGDGRAKVIGFLGSRGGLGTSTIVMNTGIGLQNMGLDTIVAELNPGRGSMALELDQADSVGLGTLLGRSLKDIHLRSVETELANHSSGARFLFASDHALEYQLEQAIPQMETIVANLASMSAVVLIDLGSGLRSYTQAMADICDIVMLVVEPIYPSNIIGHSLLEDLEAVGVGKHKLQLILISRMRSSLQMPWRQVQSDMGLELAGIVSPAAEQTHQAGHDGVPVISMHRDSLVADQIIKISEQIASILQPVNS